MHGPCRLPFELLENDKKINSGYLLSTRDLCGLEYLPFFLKAGVKSLKIEGRMKSPEYVATVTKIYRKYIDLAISKQHYCINSNDKKELMQVFNRGMSSSGHLENEPNKNLIFKEKPNNMGLFLGKVQNYQKNKGLITVKLKEPIKIGDTISLEKEQGTYTVSELMKENKNISETTIGQTVTIGRMKGNISLNDKIYKMSSKELSLNAQKSYQKENRKIPLQCEVTIRKDSPISIHVTCANGIKLYQNLNIQYTLNEIPETAKNKPLEKQTVIDQISKTTSTPYFFKKITVNLDNSVFLPKLSTLNQLRRKALEQVQDFSISQISRNYKKPSENVPISYQIKNDVLSNMRKYTKNTVMPKISVLLNQLNENWDYSKLSDYIQNIYIPLKFFTIKKYEPILKQLTQKYKIYIYLPTIIKGNYENLFYTYAEKSVKKYNIRGFVVSNIGNMKLLNALFTDLNKYFKVVANYTFHVFNSANVLELKKLGISRFTLSPELDRSSLTCLCNYGYLQKELIVYGRTPLMHLNYCLLR